MSEVNFDDMPAGQEMDALVAGVMGIPRRIYEAAAAVSDVPAYSTDIAAAWQVADILRMTLYTPGSSYADGEYANGGKYSAEGDNVRCRADSMPLAICRVALKLKVLEA